MPIRHLNPWGTWDDGPDPEQVRKRIEAYKRKLRARAKQRGLYENFGNKEFRALTDEFGVVQSDARIRAMMNEFRDWCGSYDLTQVAREG